MPSILNKGDTVQIQYGTGTVSGTLLDRLGFNGYDPIWWVQLPSSVEAFSEEDIIKWNPIPIISACECGATSIGHSGHSHWCPANIVT